jgi:hypothetical protein
MMSFWMGVLAGAGVFLAIGLIAGLWVGEWVQGAAALEAEHEEIV